MKADYAGNAQPCLCVCRGQLHRLEHELADSDDRPDDQEWIDYHLEQVATFFLRAHQQRIGRFMLVFWFIDCVC